MKGQITVPTILGVASLFGAIAAPIVYVSDIKEVNAVQDSQISRLEVTTEKIETKLDDVATKDDLERIYKQQEGILKALRSNPQY